MNKFYENNFDMNENDFMIEEGEEEEEINEEDEIKSHLQPAKTIKKQSKVDLNKSDMLQLLSFLEGELQARDIVLATLQAEKVKINLKNSVETFRNPRDPLLALQRDSMLVEDLSFGEDQVKEMYDDQLEKLEDMIKCQGRSRRRMDGVVSWVEDNYLKLKKDLEEELKQEEEERLVNEKLLQLLKQDEDKLKQELESEMDISKKLSSELDQLTEEYMKTNNQSGEGGDHHDYELIAVQLIKEQTKIMRRLGQLRSYSAELDEEIRKDQGKIKEVEREIVRESERVMMQEALEEKKISEFDFEKQQWSAKLKKAFQQQEQLTQQLQQLKEAHPEVASIWDSLEQDAENNSVVSTDNQSSSQLTTFNPKPSITSHQHPSISKETGGIKSNTRSNLTAIPINIHPSSNKKFISPTTSSFVSMATSDPVTCKQLEPQKKSTLPLESSNKQNPTQSPTPCTSKPLLVTSSSSLSSIPPSKLSSPSFLISKKVSRPLPPSRIPPPIPPNKPQIASLQSPWQPAASAASASSSLPNHQ